MCTKNKSHESGKNRVGLTLVISALAVSLSACAPEESPGVALSSHYAPNPERFAACGIRTDVQPDYARLLESCEKRLEGAEQKLSVSQLTDFYYSYSYALLNAAPERNADALIAASKALRLAPQDPDALLSQATAQSRANQFTAAIGSLESIPAGLLQYSYAKRDRGDYLATLSDYASQQVSMLKQQQAQECENSPSGSAKITTVEAVKSQKAQLRAYREAQRDDYNSLITDLYEDGALKNGRRFRLQDCRNSDLIRHHPLLAQGCSGLINSLIALSTDYQSEASPTARLKAFKAFDDLEILAGTTPKTQQGKFEAATYLANYSVSSGDRDAWRETALRLTSFSPTTSDSKVQIKKAELYAAQGDFKNAAMAYDAVLGRAILNPTTDPNRGLLNTHGNDYAAVLASMGEDAKRVELVYHAVTKTDSSSGELSKLQKALAYQNLVDSYLRRAETSASPGDLLKEALTMLPTPVSESGKDPETPVSGLGADPAFQLMRAHLELEFARRLLGSTPKLSDTERYQAAYRTLSQIARTDEALTAEVDALKSAILVETRDFSTPVSASEDAFRLAVGANQSTDDLPITEVQECLAGLTAPGYLRHPKLEAVCTRRQETADGFLTAGLYHLKRAQNAKEDKKLQVPTMAKGEWLTAANANFIQGLQLTYGSTDTEDRRNVARLTLGLAMSQRCAGTLKDSKETIESLAVPESYVNETRNLFKGLGIYNGC